MDNIGLLPYFLNRGRLIPGLLDFPRKSLPADSGALLSSCVLLDELYEGMLLSHRVLEVFVVDEATKIFDLRDFF